MEALQLASRSNADALLDGWREGRDELRLQEARLIDQTIDWMTSIAGTGPSDQSILHDIPVGGQGCPEIPETAVAEFAAVAGMTTPAARGYMADAWDLQWRLPELHARVQEGAMELWRARNVASALRGLPLEGALYIDYLVAPVAHKIGMARLRQLVVMGEILSDPDAAVARATAAAEGRTMELHPSFAADGLMDLFGRLDYADAHDLEAALQMVAAELVEATAEGVEPDSLDVRRSKALGVIARRQLAGDVPDAVTRVVHAYVHLDPDSPAARVEKGDTLVPVARIQEWCETAGTKVIVRPLLDLAEQHSRDGYVPSDTMREQAIAINRTCVHPHCTRSARSADLDHIKPYDPHQTEGPPQTVTENLAPLCRFHHRMKTHARWTYTRIEPGYYLWHSPQGRAYLRTPTGTVALSTS